MKRTLTSTTSLAFALLLVLGTHAALAQGSTTLHITLVDSQDAPVQGAKVYLGVGGWPYIGETDAAGELDYEYDGAANMRVRMTAPNHGGTQTSDLQDVTGNPNFDFETSEIEIQLKDSAGNLTDGGIVKINDGGWPVIGTTGDDGPGTVKHEHFLPYTRTFRMSYNGPTEEKSQDIGTDPIVIFQTGCIDFGSQTAHWAHGSHYYFTGLVQLLPGTYHMDIGGVGFDFTISAGDCIVARLLTLLDEDGDGVAGGKATPATGGSWNATVAGETDANGHLFAALPSGFTKIRMAVNQTSQQQMKAQLEANSYTWQTGTATINVIDHAGAALAGVVIDQGGGFWDTNKATTDASGAATIPMFAGSAKFRANWNKTSQTITQAVPSTFQFQTGSVHDTSGTCIKWATGSWNTFIQDMEVFPGSYKFVFPAPTSTVIKAISAGQVNNIP